MTRVWLASYPRSGVTFLRHVIETLYGLPTYSRYTEKASDIGGLLQLKHWPTEADAGSVCFVKTHDIDDVGSDGPAIHLVRDGRDALVSLGYFAQHYGKRGNTLEALIQETLSSPKEFSWSAHTLAWLARPNTALIHFTDLISQPFDTVRRALEELNIYLDERQDTECQPFDVLHKKAPHFFRAGGTGTWRHEMPKPLQERFMELHGSALSALNERTVWTSP